MFRRKVRSLAELLPEFLRNEGLEMPLQQKRLIDSWSEVWENLWKNIRVRSSSGTRPSM